MTRKMSCEDVLSLLSTYLDSETDDMTEANIDAHLHKCRECFSRAEFERALKKKRPVAIPARTITPTATAKPIQVRGFIMLLN